MCSKMSLSLYRWFIFTQVYVRVRPPSDDERQAKSRTVVSVTPGHPDREVEVQEKGTKKK